MADAVPGVCAHAPDRAGQVLRGQQRIRVPAHWFGPAPAPAPVRASTKRSPALANGKAVKAKGKGKGAKAAAASADAVDEDEHFPDDDFPDDFPDDLPDDIANADDDDFADFAERSAKHRRS